jgi:hypothetical protein
MMKMKMKMKKMKKKKKKKKKKEEEEEEMKKKEKTTYSFVQWSNSPVTSTLRNSQVCILLTNSRLLPASVFLPFTSSPTSAFSVSFLALLESRRSYVNANETHYPNPRFMQIEFWLNF